MLLLVVTTCESNLSAQQVSDLTCKPHAWRLQVEISSLWRIPSEVISTIANVVDCAAGALSVPESAAVVHCAVVVVSVVLPRVVVTVIRREHHVVLVTERITSVAGVPGYQQGVVGRLVEYSERTVRCVVTAAIYCVQVKSQLVAAALRQLTEQVVAEPIVASRVVESDFKLRPRTIEEVRPIHILLDQQRNAFGCRTNKKLIRRWDSERELSLRRHRARTTKYNILVHKFRHRSTRLCVGTHVFTKFTEMTQYNGHYIVEGHSRSPISY